GFRPDGRVETARIEVPVVRGDIDENRRRADRVDAKKIRLVVVSGVDNLIATADAECAQRYFNRERATGAGQRVRNPVKCREFVFESLDMPALVPAPGTVSQRVGDRAIDIGILRGPRRRTLSADG